MKVTRKSVMTGKTRTKDLPVTQAQLDRYFNGNELIQHVFPDLSLSQREFIQSGMTDEEWAEIEKHE